MNKLRWTAPLGGVLLLLATPADAAMNFCFGPTIARGVPNPVFDGNLNGEGDPQGHGDNGWLNCFTYRGGNGTPDANILLQGNSFVDGSHNWLALGVTALNDTEWDAGDSVVVLFKVKAPGTGYGQIVISPLQNDIAPATPVANGKPGTSKYYTSPDGAPNNWTLVGSAPAWVTWGAVGVASGGACSAAQHGTSCKWTAEIGFDMNVSGAPDPNGGIYIDVVEIFDRTGPKSYQFSWPPGLTLVDVTDTTVTPAVASWGGSSSSANACPGVFVGYNDISATPVDVNGNLQVGLTSTFTAKLHNSGSNANGVIAHFSHAPYGVCGLVDSCFVEFGSSSTPVSCPSGAPPCCAGTAACIPPDQPGNVGTALQATWTPVAGDEGHQCIRVKLEATVGGTQLATTGDFHNMHVDHASKVQIDAHINMKGVSAPDGGGAHQRVRLYAHKRTQYAYADGQIKEIPLGTLAEQILIQNRTFRFTGKHVTVNGVKSEVWEPVGSYGQTIQHAKAATFQQGFEQRHAALIERICRSIEVQPPKCMQVPRGIARLNAALENDPENPPASDWQTELGGVNKVGNNGEEYEVNVPLNGEVTVPTTISYVADEGGGGGTCKGCLCCFQGKKSGGATGAGAGIIALIGLLAYRRRRR
jgi:hypothetical protein